MHLVPEESTLGELVFFFYLSSVNYTTQQGSLLASVASSAQRVLEALLRFPSHGVASDPYFNISFALYYFVVGIHIVRCYKSALEGKWI